MLTYEGRALLLALLIVVLLAVFLALALWLPEDPCANVIDYCDEALRIR